MAFPFLLDLPSTTVWRDFSSSRIDAGTPGGKNGAQAQKNRALRVLPRFWEIMPCCQRMPCSASTEEAYKMFGKQERAAYMGHIRNQAPDLSSVPCKSGYEPFHWQDVCAELAPTIWAKPPAWLISSIGSPRSVFNRVVCMPRQLVWRL